MVVKCTNYVAIVDLKCVLIPPFSVRKKRDVSVVG